MEAALRDFYANRPEEALKAVGGGMQGKLWPRNDEERGQLVDAGEHGLEQGGGELHIVV